MSLTTKIEKTKRGLSLKRDAGSVQTGTPFGYWIITGVVELVIELCIRLLFFLLLKLFMVLIHQLL
jgi:hypothetical protein